MDITQKSLQIEGLNTKYNSNNYFSWCIANLGVVPLLRSAAFLFCPCFLRLLALLFFVTRVLDTITAPLYINSNSFKFISKFKYLPIYTKNVKTIILLATILSGLPLQATENTNKKESIIIARGEHHELKLNSLSHFTISNPDSLSHKYLKKSNRILLKGKALGYSELVIWYKNKKKKTLAVYVLSKKKHLSLLHIVETVNSIGLKTQLQGPIIFISGEVKELNDLRLIHQLKRDYKAQIHIKASVAPKLKKYILGKTYKLLLSEYIDQAECNFLNIKLVCKNFSNNPPSKTLKKYLLDNFFTSFLDISSGKKAKNYTLKLKIIQIEKLDGKELNFGLSRLSANLGDLFTIGVEGILRTNTLLLENKNIHYSTLAEPHINIQEDVKSTIEIGAEIPFTSQTNSQLQTSWKFAGLKVEVKLGRIGAQYVVTYKTQITRPAANGHISGNKQNSKITVVLNKPIRLFEIGFKTSGAQVQALPLISSIPILGELFKSKSSQKNFKKITAIIVLEESDV